jgi:hypothetical protein
MMFEGQPIYGWPVCVWKPEPEAKVLPAVADRYSMLNLIEKGIGLYLSAVILWGAVIGFVGFIVFWPLVCFGIASAFGQDPVLGDYRCYTWNGQCVEEEYKPSVLGRKVYIR